MLFSLGGFVGLLIKSLQSTTKKQHMVLTSAHLLLTSTALNPKPDQIRCGENHRRRDVCAAKQPELELGEPNGRVHAAERHPWGFRQLKGRADELHVNLGVGTHEFPRFSRPDSLRWGISQSNVMTSAPRCELLLGPSDQTIAAPNQGPPKNTHCVAITAG